MTHATPTKVTVEIVDDRFCDITYFGPTWKGGATARYPRQEIGTWVEKWLRPANSESEDRNAD